MKESGAPLDPKDYGKIEVLSTKIEGNISYSIIRLSGGENRPCYNNVSFAMYTGLKGSGRGYFIIDGRKIPMCEGVTVLIPPRTWFQDMPLPGEELVMRSRYFPLYDRKNVHFKE